MSLHSTAGLFACFDRRSEGETIKGLEAVSQQIWERWHAPPRRRLGMSRSNHGPQRLDDRFALRIHLSDEAGSITTPYREPACGNRASERGTCCAAVGHGCSCTMSIDRSIDGAQDWARGPQQRMMAHLSIEGACRVFAAGRDSFRSICQGARLPLLGRICRPAYKDSPPRDPPLYGRWCRIRPPVFEGTGAIQQGSQPPPPPAPLAAACHRYARGSLI